MKKYLLTLAWHARYIDRSKPKNKIFKVSSSSQGKSQVAFHSRKSQKWERERKRFFYIFKFETLEGKRYGSFLFTSQYCTSKKLFSNTRLSSYKIMWKQLRRNRNLFVWENERKREWQRVECSRAKVIKKCVRRYAGNLLLPHTP